VTTPMPPDAPALMTHQAELTDLRWVALHYLQEHAKGAYPFDCLCPMCRAARRWVDLPSTRT